jgi:hypothetical protein
MDPVVLPIQVFTIFCLFNYTNLSIDIRHICQLYVFLQIF